MLDQQYARLSTLEQEILLWLAIEREAVSVSTLRANLLQPPSIHILLDALRSLQRRSLLEKAGDGFTLQNVVIEYVTDRLVEGMAQEIMEYGVDLPQSAIRNSQFAILTVTPSSKRRQKSMFAKARNV